MADGAQPTTRRIEGQETLLARTMHAIHYNEVRDEIVVPNQFAQAILTFHGSAAGETPPLRIIQGDRTQLRGSSGVIIDSKNEEVIMENLVFAIDADGNVPPKRVLPFSVDAVDMDNDLYVSTRNQGGGTALRIFDRNSDSDQPLRVIYGPRTMLVNPTRMRVYNGWIIVNHDGVQARVPNNLSFVGIWSINDEGNVPPRWTYGGPNKMLDKPRGVDLDPRNQAIIVSDKTLNAVLTYHAPEVFGESGEQFARRGESVPVASRDSEPDRSPPVPVAARQ